MLCKLFKSCTWLLLVTLIMAGCGQSGSLYLPDKNENHTARK